MSRVKAHTLTGGGSEMKLDLEMLLDQVKTTNVMESEARGRASQAANEASAALRIAVRDFAVEIRPLVVSLGGFRGDNGLAKELIRLFDNSLDNGPSRG